MPESASRRSDWQLTLVVSREAATTLTRALRDLGALGVFERAVDPGRASLAALFEGALERDRLVARLDVELAALGIAVFGQTRLSVLAAGDWAEGWPEYFVPLAAGRRLLVVPAWIERIVSDRVPIVIEPGGFGTGHHPSTAGCLQALERLVDRDRPDHAIDLGTGSGILAIAAARLGVTRVVAVDADPAAVKCAGTNAERNRVADRVRCVLGDAAALPAVPAPLVVANLRAPAHVAMAERYAGLVMPGGSLVLGGIEEREADEVTGALTGAGFVSHDRVTIAGWATLVFSACSSSV